MANKYADPSEPVQYPGRMATYPGMVKGQPPAYVHDCVPGCPGMPKRPLVPIAGDSGPKTAKGGGGGFQSCNPGQTQFPGQVGLTRPVGSVPPVKGAKFQGIIVST